MQNDFIICPMLYAIAMGQIKTRFICTAHYSFGTYLYSLFSVMVSQVIIDHYIAECLAWRLVLQWSRCMLPTVVALSSSGEGGKVFDCLVRSTLPSRPNAVCLNCPSARPYVRPSVRPQNVSSISMKFGM